MSSDRWTHSEGSYGNTVRVEERYGVAKNVYLTYYDPDQGREVERSLGFKVRDPESGELIEDAVKRAIGEAKEASRRKLEGQRPVPERITAAYVWEQFKRWALRNLPSDRRRKTVRRHLEAMLYGEAGVGAQTPALQVSQDFCDRWARQRMAGEIDCHGKPVAEEKQESQAVSAGTVAYELASLRQVFKWAAEKARDADGKPLLRFDPLKGLDTPSEKNPSRPVASDEKYRKLREVAHKHEVGAGNNRNGSGKVPSPLYTLLTVVGETGVRKTEAAHLRWSDLLWEEGPHGAIRWRAEHQKTGRGRTVPITALCREALEAWREIRLTQFGVPGDEDWVFPAPKSDGPVRLDVLHDWWLWAEEEAGFEHPDQGGWHELRRRWASKRKHLSPQDVALAGGWKDVNTMMTSYQQADPETVQAVVLAEEAAG